jgi:ABC-type phosphate transport system substrate-binding protein
MSNEVSLNSQEEYCSSAVVFTGLSAIPGQLCPDGGGRRGGQAIQVKGSDTMVNLSTHWAEVFIEEHPGAQISVTGGGSGTGIAALLNGTADLLTLGEERDLVHKA